MRGMAVWMQSDDRIEKMPVEQEFETSSCCPFCPDKTPGLVLKAVCPCQDAITACAAGKDRSKSSNGDHDHIPYADRFGLHVDLRPHVEVDESAQWKCSGRAVGDGSGLGSSG